MRIKISNLSKALAVVMVSVLAVSCTKNYLDYNTPRDEPTTLQGDRAYIQNLQNHIIPLIKNRYQHCENLIGGVYGRYFAYGQGNGWSTSYIYYNAAEGWLNNPFEIIMTNVFGNWVQVKVNNDGEGINYQWAQLLRVAAMHRMADIYGPMPYSQLDENSGVSTPYDSLEDLYYNMFADLKTAIDELTMAVATDPDDRSRADWDYVYGGDFTKWIKFANSLRLRMAMRLAYIDPDKAEEETLAALNHPYGVITANSDNAQILSQTSDQNPLRWMVIDYKDCVAGAEIVTYMNSYSDPRIASYFNQAANSDSYVGVRVSSPSTDAWHPDYSLPKVVAEDPIMWINASEVAFLKAEAALRGWISDSAEELYEEGIRLSFEQYGLTAQLNTYMENTATPTGYTDPTRGTYSYSPANPYTVTIPWDAAANEETKLEKIITQKWIAIYPLGTEAWAEQRRTGYPRFYPTLNNRSMESGLDNTGAARVVFAPSEKERNLYYDDAVGLLGGGDLYGTRLWWDVKTNKPAW